MMMHAPAALERGPAGPPAGLAASQGQGLPAGPASVPIGRAELRLPPRRLAESGALQVPAEQLKQGIIRANATEWRHTVHASGHG